MYTYQEILIQLFLGILANLNFVVVKDRVIDVPMCRRFELMVCGELYCLYQIILCVNAYLDIRYG